MKRCGICGEEKSFEDFNKNNCKADGLQTNCRECMKVKAKGYYLANNEKQKIQINEARNRRRDENKLKLYAIKSNPCLDCNQSYPHFVMDFDHVSGEKILAISEMMQRAMPWNKIQEEIDKCELVCANCHRIRTFTRR